MKTKHTVVVQLSSSNKPYILSILSYMHVIYENIHKRVFCYSPAQNALEWVILSRREPGRARVSTSAGTTGEDQSGHRSTAYHAWWPIYPQTKKKVEIASSRDKAPSNRRRCKHRRVGPHWCTNKRQSVSSRWLYVTYGKTLPAVSIGRFCITMLW